MTAQSSSAPEDRGVTPPLWRRYLAFLAPMIFSNFLQSVSGTVNNVAVVNLLPSGLEVENPRLATTERLDWMQEEKTLEGYQDLRDEMCLNLEQAGFEFQKAQSPVPDRRPIPQLNKTPWAFHFSWSKTPVFFHCSGNTGFLFQKDEARASCAEHRNSRTVWVKGSRKAMLLARS